MNKLDKYKNTQSYKVPKDYFKESKREILGQVGLYAKHTDEGYATPSGYFEQRKKQLLLSVNDKRKYTALRSLYTYAGAIAAMCIGVWFFTSPSQTQGDDWELIPEEAFIAYLSQDTDINTLLVEEEVLTESHLEDLEYYDMDNIEEFLESNIEEMDITELNDFLNI